MTRLGMHKNRLLLVDDDEVFLGVLSKAMINRGYDVVAAPGIDDALTRFERVFQNIEGV